MLRQAGLGRLFQVTGGNGGNGWALELKRLGLLFKVTGGNGLVTGRCLLKYSIKPRNSRYRFAKR